MRVTYSKTRSVPEGTPFLTTSTGLKYWHIRHPPSGGLQASVETEDPEISMHAYGSGSRDGTRSFMFCYKDGFRIGFSCACFIDGLPWGNIKRQEDIDQGKREGKSIIRITAIGTPVTDFATPTETERSTILCGPTWNEFYNGKRTLFPSLEIQNEMRMIWLELFGGLRGKFLLLDPAFPKTLPDGSAYPQITPIFDEAVMQQFANGDLVDAKS
ncbi:hypothetical protein [Halocynthiibacter styelae]|uniref:Uncharacterized protein n=1 Tax=Halocynthiibacter styelae TaxID=2761955 RepID=A0A8J7LQC6_9RHOB|nr:hypothetical protein [Paenihalocynthiibacter styelae]MBI1494936.1 hypothetical protein [Paenihalocynthiibacter styelae]